MVTLRLPPSGLKPAATAMAATSVDLPLAFSPAKSVTRESSFSSSSCRIAGMENGYIEALDLVSLQEKRADKEIVGASRTLHQASRLAAVLNSRHGIALYGRT